MELGMLDYLIGVSVFMLVLTTLLYYYSRNSISKGVKGEYFPVKTHEQIINQIPTLRKLDSNSEQYKEMLGKMIRRNTDWNRVNAEEIEIIKACIANMCDKKKR